MAIWKFIIIALITAAILSTMPFSNAAVASNTTTQTISSGGTIMANQITLALMPSVNPAKTNNQILISGLIGGASIDFTTSPVRIQFTQNQEIWQNIAIITPNANGLFETQFAFPKSGTYLVRATYNDQISSYTQVIADLFVNLNGTEDSTDIQTAIDTLPSGGGTVYVRSGLYDLNGKTIVVKSGLNLIGEGIDQTIIRMYPTKHTSSMSIEYVITSRTLLQNMVLENFTVVQNVVPVNHHGAIVLIGINNNDITIRNLKVTDISGAGISVHRYNNLLIENCIVERAWTGIVIANGSNALIRDNTIIDTTGDGIFPEDQSNNVIIENNYLQNIGDTGIDISCPQPGIHKNTIIRNNTIIAGTLRVTNAINVQVIGNYINGKLSIDAGQGHPVNVSIVGNTIVSNYEVGIAFLGAFNSSAINNVIIMQPPAGNTTQSGIYAAFWQNGIILNNTIDNAANYGIDFQTYALGGGNYNITIAENIIQNFGNYGLYDDNKYQGTIYVMHNTFAPKNIEGIAILIQNTNNNWTMIENTIK